MNSSVKNKCWIYLQHDIFQDIYFFSRVTIYFFYNMKYFKTYVLLIIGSRAQGVRIIQKMIYFLHNKNDILYIFLCMYSLYYNLSLLEIKMIYYVNDTLFLALSQTSTFLLI